MCERFEGFTEEYSTELYDRDLIGLDTFDPRPDEQRWVEWLDAKCKVN
jgi:hypothetical protein